MDLLRATIFFRPKIISKVAIMKTKSATTAFFSCPPFLLLALSFSPFSFVFFTEILELISGLKNLPFDAFSLKRRKILLGSVGFQKIAYICIPFNIE